MPDQPTSAIEADNGFKAYRKPRHIANQCVGTSFYPRWTDRAMGAAMRVDRAVLPETARRRRRLTSDGAGTHAAHPLLQQWYALSDPTVEEVPYDSAAIRRFVGIDREREPAPDEATARKFRHLLEKHGSAAQLFKAVNQHIHEQRPKLPRRYNRGCHGPRYALVDKESRQVERPADASRQTRKGNQWYFGMKAHVGVNERTGLIHNV